jgi:hypothetical protein
MTPKEIFGAASLILSVVSYVPYVRSIFVANTKPHAFTWLVWGAVMAIAFLAQLSDRAGAGSWATGLSAAFCLGIGIIALFRGEKHITRGDWIAFTITFLAIPLWVATSDPLWSVLLVTGIDAVAYYPTFRKSYSKTRRGTGFQIRFDGHQISVQPAGTFYRRDQCLPVGEHRHGEQHRRHAAMAPRRPEENGAPARSIVISTPMHPSRGARRSPAAAISAK